MSRRPRPPGQMKAPPLLETPATRQPDRVVVTASRASKSEDVFRAWAKVDFRRFMGGVMRIRWATPAARDAKTCKLGRCEFFLAVLRLSLSV